MILKNLMALTAALALASSASAQIELTSNGGFEAGDVSDWVSFPTGDSTFDVTADANSGAWAGEVLNLATGSAAVIKQANLGIGTVSPGQEITISFAAKGTFGVGGVSFIEFFSELDGGGTSSAEILGTVTPSDTYLPYSFTTTAGPDVSGGVTLQFTATTGAVIDSTAQLFVDDVSVTVIPEPATATLVSLLGLGLTARRRR